VLSGANSRAGSVVATTCRANVVLPPSVVWRPPSTPDTVLGCWPA